MDAGEWPVFRYRFGEVTLTRELMLIPGHRLLLVRYEVRGTAPDTPPVVLRVKPCLPFAMPMTSPARIPRCVPKRFRPLRDLPEAV